MTSPRGRTIFVRSLAMLVAFQAAIFASGSMQQPDASAEDRAEIARLLVAANYADAESRARVLVTGLERTHPDSLSLARALDLLVQSLVEGGKPADPAALPSATRAVAIKEQIPGAGDAELAISLVNLGLVLRRQGKLEAARETYERALRLRQTALGPAHPDVARVMAALCALASNAGDFARARELGMRAVAIAERAEPRDRTAEAVAANNLAQALFQLNDYDGARQRLEQALHAYETALGGDHPEVGKTLSNLANVVGETGDLTEARRLYERAIAIQEKRQGPDHLDVALNVNNLADVFYLVGDYETSAALFTRALRVLERAYGPDHTRVAMALGNLAQVRAAQDDRQQARAMYTRALAIREKAVGPDHPSLVYTLTGFAELHARLGEHDAAAAKFERALAISERAFGPEHPATALALQGLGDLRLAEGRTADAKVFIDRALENRTQLLGNDHPLVAESRASLALMLARTGQTAAALEAALEAERVSRAHLQITAQALAERHALSYAEHRVSGAAVALSILASTRAPDAADVRRTWDAVVRSRALVFEEMAARQRLVAVTTDPDVARRARELTNARQRLAGLLVRHASDPASRERIREAIQERDTAERALAERSVEFRTEQARVRTGIDDAARSLTPGAALVAFVRFAASPIDDAVTRRAPRRPDASGQEQYLAFVMRGDHATPAVIPLGPAAAIDSRINRWRAEIRGEIESGLASTRSERVHRELGTAIRRLIWDPLLPALSSATQIFIVPTGPLHLVNWGTLPGANGRYVVEGPRLIHYLSSERDLTAPDTPAAAGLLLVDSPAYQSAAARPAPSPTAAASQSRACADLASLRFDPLPESRREGDAIAALWRSVAATRDPPALVRLNGAAATEAQVRERIRGSRVVHFATHGFFLGAWCARPSSSSSTRHPLLLAGLALAGANARQTRPADDDGVLLAEEITTLDMRGVEWAVLSACDTGTGVVDAGDELFGLRRAFQVAGVRTVIVSLWPVDDETTRRWMDAVYRARFVQTGSTAAAVRTATVSAIRSLRARGRSTHPAHWGAFVATGGS